MTFISSLKNVNVVKFLQEKYYAISTQYNGGLAFSRGLLAVIIFGRHSHVSPEVPTIHTDGMMSREGPRLLPIFSTHHILILFDS